MCVHGADARRGDEPQVGDFPVIYALHPRDISYEVGEKNGPDSVSSLLSGELSVACFGIACFDPPQGKQRCGAAHCPPAHRTVLGIETWLSGVVCALNDPRMEPHLLVVPLRGGDRMWLDCYNKSICALETAIVDVCFQLGLYVSPNCFDQFSQLCDTAKRRHLLKSVGCSLDRYAQDLIPFIERSFPTKDVFSSAGTTNRACIGTSVGASGCLNLVRGRESGNL